MNFNELHELVPYARFGKPKSLTMQPYNGITLAMPGRHAEDCSPKGGDFVVMVDDSKLNWKMHQFKHDDIFNDIQEKVVSDALLGAEFMVAYYEVITGGDPVDYRYRREAVPGLHRQTLLYALQCLAVAEHRRYHIHEAKFGGRYLPFRFAAGIAEGLWTAAEGAEIQRYGRPALERLERKNGVPALTQKLMT